MRYGIITGLGIVCVLLGESASGQSCTITFDATCPTAVSDQCGAFFDGGGGCIFAGLPFCYDTGTLSYRVTDATPLSITIPGGLSALEVFFSQQGTASGEMRFFDAETGGSEVDTPFTTNGNCLSFMPARQSISFTNTVHRIEVTATGGAVWIDTFIATAPPDCSGVGNCSGNGTCIATDTCQCDAGWEGTDCSTFNCTDVNNCSANGTCVGANTCVCNQGFTESDCSVAIPAVSEWGLVTMSLLVLAAGTVLLRRRRTCHA